MTDTPTEGGGQGTWAKLRRRKVVQWTLVYVAAAWGFLQGLDYVGDAFQWPPQLRQIALLALLIGLPIVLVVSYYHGDRGQQRITTPEFAIVMLLLLLGGGAFWYYQRASEAGRDAAPTASTAQPDTSPGIKDARPSVAVLPFENRSREADDAFFVDGIHDDILTQLTKVGALRVIARTSVEQFRNTKLTTREIGERLGVTKILEGGVQRAGDRVRIHVQLIDAGTDAHLWAESYDRDLTAANIFAIQSEVAGAIAGALKAALTIEEQARIDAISTQNLEAWQAYQLGKQRLAKRTSEGMIEAEHYFRQAIDLDRKFALAHVGWATAVALQIDYNGAPFESTLARAEGAVAEALKLEPNVSEAWAASGLIAHWRGRLGTAESMFKRAIALNPNNATAHFWYTFVLRDEGRLDEAITEIKMAVELDPLYPIIFDMMGALMELRGRFQEADGAYRRAIDIDPSRPGGYDALASLNAYAFNRYADAVSNQLLAIERDPGSLSFTNALGILYFDLGEDAQASKIFSASLKRAPDDYRSNRACGWWHSFRRDQKIASICADKLLEQDSRNTVGMMVLRNRDLLAGHTEVARARYLRAYPELFGAESVRVDGSNWSTAIDLALVLQKLGDGVSAVTLLNRGEQSIRSLTRLGWQGYGIADVRIHALRGDKAKALVALREAERAGWRGPWWRYYRDIDPNLASIRDDPEFKAIFADIERDMARQRAQLAARPKDAPPDLAAVH